MRTQNLYSFGKTVHFGTNTIDIEIESQGQCTKDVQHFFGCKAF